jgi:hypothetical protein
MSVAVLAQSRTSSAATAEPLPDGSGFAVRTQIPAAADGKLPEKWSKTTSVGGLPRSPVGGTVVCRKEFYSGKLPGVRHRKNGFASEVSVTDANLRRLAYDMKAKRASHTPLEALSDLPGYRDRRVAGAGWVTPFVWKTPGRTGIVTVGPTRMRTDSELAWLTCRTGATVLYHPDRS